LSTTSCPLCGGAPEDCRRDSRNCLDIECQICGTFNISEEAIETLNPEQKPFLSAYCRRLSKTGPPTRILTSNMQELVDSVPRYTPKEKLDNLLLRIGEASPALFEYSTFDFHRDYPLICAPNRREVERLISELATLGYLNSNSSGYALTLDGWAYLEEIQRTGRSSNRVFVAMWFDVSREPVYKRAIGPAITDAGFDPLRVDKHEHVNRIDDEIIAQIRKSRFLVADLTGQRHGVYFEAGMMTGLGRNVIWLCDKQEVEEGKLHFDVRQFNFIAYDSIDDARTRLYNRIVAIEGEGPGVFPKPGS